MISLETRKSKPLQTKDNVLAMLHNEGVTFHLLGVNTYMVTGDRRTIDARCAQLQEITDLAARHNFYRDGLRQAINAAFGEVYTQLWNAINDRPKGGITFLKINSRLNDER
ncbi:hypothetical protein ABWZ84_002262 [Vibrio cholerae]